MASLSLARSSRPPSPPPPYAPTSPHQLAVFGDSFCGVFSLLGNHCRVERFSGASARGLGNPNSTRQLGARILADLERTRPANVLLMFGQVDFAVNYLWQLMARMTEATGPAAWADKVFHDYGSFLATRIAPLARASKTRICVAGVLPPVVEDSYLEACASKYIERVPGTKLAALSLSTHRHDLHTRHAMVRRYNALLSTFCARHSDCLTYVEINRDLTDRSDPLGRVRADFLDQADPTNIHLLWESTLPLWLRSVPPLAPLAARLATPSEQARLQGSLARFRSEKRERVRQRGSTGSSSGGNTSGGS